jgi:intracellular septation protein
MMPKSMTAQPPVNPFLKLTLELGPLIVFFLANARWGIFTATGVFMVGVVGALIASYKLLHRVPIMTVVSAVVVVVFGGLTLVLQNDVFIKIKPTIIYLLFCTVLLGGLAWGKPLLALVFDSVFDLTAEGWRKLTWRWALFFLALAVLNEIVWRTQTTDAWLSFKVFGVVPLTFLFAASQYPLLNRYAAKTNRSPDERSEIRGS